MPPVAPVVADAVKQVLRSDDIPIDSDEVEETVKIAIKQAVKHAVREVVEDVVEQQLEPEAKASDGEAFESLASPVEAK
jgi:hypothetical protein